MDESESAEILKYINEFRKEKDLNSEVKLSVEIGELQDLSTVLNSSFNLTVNKTEKSLLIAFTNCVNEDSNLLAILSLRDITHVGITSHINADTNDKTISLNFFQYFGVVDQISPMIDGSLVIQGSTLANYGPALCTVEYSKNDEDYEIVAIIPPWQMDFTLSEQDNNSNNGLNSFTILVSLGSDIKEGNIRIKIYVDKSNDIPYETNDDNNNDKKKDEYNMDPSSYIQAIEYITKSVIETSSSSDIIETDDDAAAVADNEISPETQESLEPVETVNDDTNEKKADDDNDNDNDNDDSDVENDLKPTHTEDSNTIITTSSSSSSSTTIIDTDDLVIGENSSSTVLSIQQQPQAPILVVSDIKVVFDYEEVLHLRTEGYELHTSALSDTGIERDVDHLWKFYFLAKLGRIEDGGLEDIDFLRCPKELGTLPTLEGFTVYADGDLTRNIPDCKFSVFLAAKFGPTPKFNGLTQMSLNFDLDLLMSTYLASTNSIFVKAPLDICKAMNGIAGIVLSLPKAGGNNNGKSTLKPIGLKSRYEGRRKSSVPMSESAISARSEKGGENNNNSHIHSQKNISFHNIKNPENNNDEDDENESNNDDEDEDEKEASQSLLEDIEEIQKQKESLVEINNDLQRRCCELILKENEIRSHTSTIRKLSNIGNNNNSGNNNGNDTNNANANNNDEESQEEIEHLYLQMINNIKEKRIKLINQQQDFDQLALDLQTRLDDKEVKMKQVSTAYAKLKKDTLSHTVNSLTGKKYTKKEIEEIDEIEQKKYDALEKVRIKNISLRSNLKKMERILRHKEQLAEGLHVIDFEQLKIENQSLHEKIQERNDEIIKLKRKRTLAIQVLTHIREKLYFLEKTNLSKSEILFEVEQRILRMRSLLSSVRQDRDEKNQENKELKTRQQFASSNLLIKDFEDRKGYNEELKDQLNELKIRYNQLKMKVDASNNQLKTKSLSSSSSSSHYSPMKPTLAPLTSKKIAATKMTR